MRDNIIQMEERILAACARSKRERSEVTLIAVSKTKPEEMLLEAYENGIRHFGENKVQELVEKYEDLNNQFSDPVYWHMIGHLQRNKVKYIVDKAVLIHSVDSLRLAQQINEEAAKKQIICDILLEVNIAGEETKYGMKPEEVPGMVAELTAFPHIRVRGLMTVAPYVENPEKNREHFKNLRRLYVDIKSKNTDNINDDFNILSMGMTGDFDVAIEEGATMVRIGTGIFGERDYSI